MRERFHEALSSDIGTFVDLEIPYRESGTEHPGPGPVPQAGCNGICRCDPAGNVMT